MSESAHGRPQVVEQAERDLENTNQEDDKQDSHASHIRIDPDNPPPPYISGLVTAGNGYSRFRRFPYLLWLVASILVASGFAIIIIGIVVFNDNVSHIAWQIPVGVLFLIAGVWMFFYAKIEYMILDKP
jgi:hypothetical protein